STTISACSLCPQCCSPRRACQRGSLHNNIDRPQPRARLSGRKLVYSVRRLALVA
ncbi:hypothetical protein BaRGS_00013190, partial [Batillaria attramentaria]